MTREPWRSLFLALLVTLLVAYSRPFSGLTAPNERSRLYLAVAVVDHGTFAVDEVVARFGPTLDLAHHGGHRYSDKAPGASLIGAVVYGILRIAGVAESWGLCELLEAVRLGGILPLSLVGFFVFRRLLRDRGAAPGVIDSVSLAWVLASPAFHYSSAFYGHQVVGVLALLALFCVRRSEEQIGPAPRRWLYAVLGGSCVGLALLSEYQAAILAVALVGYVLTGPMRRSVGDMARFLAPLGIGAAALLAYNAACFGGPLELSYHHLANAALRRVHEKGIGGVTLPSSEAVVGALLSLHRGLFATCPWIAAAILGAAALWRRGVQREAALLLGTSLAYVLFVGSSNMWVAGWSYGPRLLVPVLGWMALLVAPALSLAARLPLGSALLRGLVLAALFGYQTVSVTFAELPPEATNPAVDVVAPALAQGLVSPNIPSLLGWAPGMATLIPWLLLLLIVAVLILAADWRGAAQVNSVPSSTLAPEGGGVEAPARRNGAWWPPGHAADALARGRLAWLWAIVAVACALGFVYVEALSGPGWSDVERERFLVFLHQLVVHESGSDACDPL